MRCGFYMQNSFNRTTTKFCTIHGNMATSTECVYPNTNDFLLSYSNIINNSVSDRLICSSSNGIIESCVVLNNNGKNIFYCLLNSITVIHCFCNQTERFGNVNISFIHTKPFINNINHFSSYLCQATKLNLYLKDEILSKNIKNLFSFFRYHPIINYTQLLC